MPDVFFLWNDFTHFLTDPLHGDQEMQHEGRATLGIDVAYTHPYSLFGVTTEVQEGLHGRYDYNNVSRIPTQGRVPLNPAELAEVDYPPFYSETDEIHLGSVAGFVQVTSHWTDWLRSVLGFREDYMHGSDSGTNYGSASVDLAHAAPEERCSARHTRSDTRRHPVGRCD